MRTVFLACIAMAILLPGCGTGPAEDDPDLRTVLTVSKSGDDSSEGTLRWAIVKSNAAPGKYNIVLTPPTGGSLLIAPESQLPAIAGPVRVQGPWNRSGTPTVVLDGSQWLKTASDCAGPDVRSREGVGLRVVDSRDVEISGFEVRNFCTGIMSLRSHDNFIHDMRLAGNVGAAGILITGDDESAAGASGGNSTHNTVERNVFVNNSDGIDISFGATGTIVRGNTFTLDAGRAGSSGIDIASSDNVVIDGNRIEGYLIGIQVDASGAKLTSNVVRANRVGVVHMAGTSKLITLSENLIYDNGRDLQGLNARINLSLNGVEPSILNDGASACADAVPDCKLPQNYPVLAGSTSQASGFVVRGTLSSRANAKFSIEFFASRTDGIKGIGEGQVFLGKVDVTTNASGIVPFSFTTGTDPLKDETKDVYFTATATRTSNGQTSEFSLPDLVVRP